MGFKLDFKAICSSGTYLNDIKSIKSRNLILENP